MDRDKVSNSPWEVYMAPHQSLAIQYGPEGSISGARYQCQQGDRVMSVEDDHVDDLVQGDRVMICDGTGERLYEMSEHGPRLICMNSPGGALANSGDMHAPGGDAALIESALRMYATAVRELPQQMDSISIWDDIDADDLSV